ncbi:MAG: L,D-transpeptidase family protein [Inquilinus sp.]|nr:L,D-transpeptidase family protein [Inquilinus sp.]
MIGMQRLMSGLPALAAAALLTASASPATASDLVGRMGIHVASYEDTLLEVARQFDLGFVEMRAANPEIDPWLPGAGRHILLPSAHLLPDAPREGVVINLAEMRLYYFPTAGAEPQTFPIGIGREGWTTPVGQTTVVRKKVGPAWYPPASIRAEKPYLPAVVEPGPDNPLGTHAVYLGWPAYLIHGTNNPWGIGRRVSSGCIRMYPEDIISLFGMVPVGTKVTVVDQPIKFGLVDGDLYIEVHPSQTQVDMLETEGRFEQEVPEGVLTEARGRTESAEGVMLNVAATLQAVKERRGYPVRISR